MHYKRYKESILGNAWIGNPHKQKWALLYSSCPGPESPGQLPTLVPFAVAKSGCNACLGISWPSEISN